MQTTNRIIERLVRQLNGDLTSGHDGLQSLDIIKMLSGECDWTDGGEHCYKQSNIKCPHCTESSEIIKFTIPFNKQHTCDKCSKNIYSGAECMRCVEHDFDYCVECYGEKYVSTHPWSKTSHNIDVRFNIFEKAIGFNKGKGVISQNNNIFNGVTNNTTGHAVCPIVRKNEYVTGNIYIHKGHGLNPETNPKGIHVLQNPNIDTNITTKISMVVYLFHGYNLVGTYFVNDVNICNIDISKMQDIDDLSKIVGFNIDTYELINKGAKEAMKAGMDGKKGSEGFFKVVFVPCSSVNFGNTFNTEEDIHSIIKSNITNMKQHLSEKISEYNKIVSDCFEKIKVNSDVMTKFDGHPYNEKVMIVQKRRTK